MRKVIACGVALTALLLLLLGMRSENPLERLRTLFGGESALTVGQDVLAEDVEEFYYTASSSAYPPEFLRYRLWTEADGYWFSHEKREGNHWPLTEQDITVSGSVELTQEKWDEFMSCLAGGKVTKRRDSAESGSGTWMYLYWQEDRGQYQEFSFASPEQRKAFEDFCVLLTES